MVWLKIEEVANRTGLTKRTIRYYEELGILAPPERSERKSRLIEMDHHAGEQLELIEQRTQKIHEIRSDLEELRLKIRQGIEKKHSHPLLHIPLFFNRIFTLGIVSATLNGIARMSVMFMLIFYFQGALSYDALQAGILTIPLAVGMFIFSPISGWIGDKYGETFPATFGLFVTLIGLIGLALDTSLTTPYWQMALWMSLVGIGAGLFNSPNSSSIMNAAGVKYRGEASGIRSLTVNMGMMLSIAFTMPLITHSMPREAMLAIFSGTKVGLDDAATSLHSFITGLHVVFWVMSALLVLATILSFMRASGKKIELQAHNLN